MSKDLSEKSGAVPVATGSTVSLSFWQELTISMKNAITVNFLINDKYVFTGWIKFGFIIYFFEINYETKVQQDCYTRNGYTFFNDGQKAPDQDLN
jgi:hypothetical protein